MTGYAILAEEPIETARLRLFHLRTSPRRQSAGRVLVLGGSSYDLRLRRQFLDWPIFDRFEVAAYEPRGVGRSGRPDGDWTMRDYAEDAVAFLDALGWDRVHVLGYSFGGMTALHLALLAPDRVARLAVLAATPGGAGGRSYDISEFLDLPREEAAERWLMLQDTTNAALKARDPDAFAERLAARVAFDEAFAEPSVRSGGYRRLLAARAAHDVWGRLAEIRQEVQVMAGESDGQAPAEIQRRMAEALPNAVFRAYPGGHNVAFEHPEPMRDLVAAWTSA